MVDRPAAKDIVVRAGDLVVLHDHVHDFLVLQAAEPADDVHLKVGGVGPGAGDDRLGGAGRPDAVPGGAPGSVWLPGRAEPSRAAQAGR